MAIKIKQGVPMPKIARDRECKYPFGDMCVGDMFEFDKEQVANVNAARQYYRISRGKEYNFAIRQIKHDTYGCWRIA